jgi:uncharacterized metal-binding protein (TIGR02443 family)
MRRQFIAGAQCPKCNAMDKIVLLRLEDGGQRRECVACGFTDSLDQLGSASELPTRVNQAQAPAEEVQAVKLLDPKG